jgi:tripartite-type tricarboxylate transporter receptor subunit TctC
VTPYIHSGKIRGLAVTSGERSPLAPELPTVAEAGLPGFQLEVWWGLIGPSGLPAPVLKRLSDELNTALGLADVRDLLAREGATPRPGTPEEFGNLIRSEVARWSQLIKDAHIELE